MERLTQRENDKLMMVKNRIMESIYLLIGMKIILKQ